MAGHPLHEQSIRFLFVFFIISIGDFIWPVSVLDGHYDWRMIIKIADANKVGIFAKNLRFDRKAIEKFLDFITTFETGRHYFDPENSRFSNMWKHRCSQTPKKQSFWKPFKNRCTYCFVQLRRITLTYVVTLPFVEIMNVWYYSPSYFICNMPYVTIYLTLTVCRSTGFLNK